MPWRPNPGRQVETCRSGSLHSRKFTFDLGADAEEATVGVALAAGFDLAVAVAEVVLGFAVVVAATRAMTRDSSR